MSPLPDALDAVTRQSSPRTWLVTGVAGFIGSNLLEQLLKLDQTVVGLDNFSTGKQSNLDEIQALVGAGRWAGFRFVEGDIRDPRIVPEAERGNEQAMRIVRDLITLDNRWHG